MNIITIDCGASFIKGARFCGTQKQKELKKPAPGAARQPLCGIDRIIALRSLVKEMVLELCSDGEDCYLCVSNEMHGFLLTNEDGEPVTDYISWQIDLGDTRLSAKNLPIADRIIRTGMPIRGGLPSSNLSWLSSNGKLREKYRFYTLGDYLIRFLSGMEPGIHTTNAAATGLYDLEKREWDPEIIGYISAESIVFPEIVSDISSGMTEFRMGNSRLIALPAIGDQQAALLGAGLEDLKTLSFNMGTGAQVSRLSEYAVFSENWQVRPFFSDRYLLTIPFIPSGRAVNVFFRFIKSVLERYGEHRSDEEIWQGISAAAEKGMETNMQMDLGFFENAVNDSTKGSIKEIAEFDLTMDNLFYAVISRITENSLAKAELLQVESIQRLLFSGGISERFPVIKERIIKTYDKCEAIQAKGDTLEGLMRYAYMQMGEPA